MICPYCNKEAFWCDNVVVYGKRYGKSYMCYYCAPCDAYVGCHNNTREPLGTMANKELRNQRMKCHKVVDALWKPNKNQRKNVYRRLAHWFGRPIHIGESDMDQCRQILEQFSLIFGDGGAAGGGRPVERGEK